VHTKTTQRPHHANGPRWWPRAQSEFPGCALLPKHRSQICVTEGMGVNKTTAKQDLAEPSQLPLGLHGNLSDKTVPRDPGVFRSPVGTFHGLLRFSGHGRLCRM
jgi:hypothetical protein